MKRSALRNLILGVGVLGLSACAAPRPFETMNPTAPSVPGAGEGVQTQAVEPPTTVLPGQPLPTVPPPRPRTLGPATKALVAQAQSQLDAGQDALAAATLERALRIEPDNPLIWLELAKLRQIEGNAAQAENMARKALAMASGEPRIQAAAWRTIADAYRARGRNPEAQEADARAAALSNN